MSRQIGSNRSLSYPSNLQRHSPIISLSEFTPYLVPSYTNNSPGMDSDDTSTNTVFHTVSQFNNSDNENPDELADFEPSPSTFSQPPPLQPLHTPIRDENSSAPSSYTDALQFSLQRPATHLTPLAPLMENSRMN